MVENCRYCGTGHPRRQCLAYGKNTDDVRREITSEKYAKVQKGRDQGQRSLQRSKTVHEVQQNEEPYTREHDDSGRNCDSVNIRYLNFDDVKSVILTKLELSTSQKELK